MQLGRIVPGSASISAKSGVGVAVRSGARKPDIGSVEALKRALARGEIDRLFQRTERRLSVRPIRAPGNRRGAEAENHANARRGVGRRAGRARGNRDLLQQVPELLPIAGIDYVGPLPREIQAITVFSGGIHSGADEPEAARAC